MKIRPETASCGYALLFSLIPLGFILTDGNIRHSNGGTLLAFGLGYVILVVFGSIAGYEFLQKNVVATKQGVTIMDVPMWKLVVLATVVLAVCEFLP